MRSIMKKMTALVMTVALAVSLLPWMSMDSVAAAPGARHYKDRSGNVFLGGNYIEVGICSTGIFGTTAAPTPADDWHFISGNQSGGAYLGLIADGDGWDVGEAPVAGDFFTPGTPEERWIFSYKLDGTIKEYVVAGRYASYISSQWNEVPTVSDTSEGDTLSATVTGVTLDNVKVTITYYFGVNDLSYKTSVNIVNNSGSELTDARFVRSFDPDQDQWFNYTFETYNKVICNPVADKTGGVDNFAMVVARGATTGAGVFFLSFDNRARASRGVSFSPYSAYLSGLWDSAPVTEKNFADDAAVEFSFSNTNGYTYEDDAIAITTNFGTISDGASDSTEYITSLNPDVTQELNSVLSAAIKTTDTTITISDPQDDEYYALYCGDDLLVGWFDKEGAPAGDYSVQNEKYTVEPTSDGDIMISGLEPNTVYVVKNIKKENYDEADNEPTDSEDVGENEATTQIDPMSPPPSEPDPDNPDAPVTPVVKPTIGTPTQTTVTLNNPIPGYTYSLQDYNGNTVSYTTDSSDESKLVFKDLTPNTTYYLVAKIPGSSNSSARIEVKTANLPPEVSGIEDGKTYCERVEFTAEDPDLDYVKVDGNSIAASDGKYTIVGDDESHTVVVADKAGNTLTYEIRVNEGHTPEAIGDRVEPGCFDTGVSEGSKCSLCGQIIEEQCTIDALGHDWSGEWEVVKEATETEEGKRVLFCKRDCGYKRIEVIPSTGTSDEPVDNEIQGDFTKDAEVTPDAPITDAVVNNSKTELYEAEGIFSEAEKEAIAAGAEARVWMKIDELPIESLTDDEISKIEAAVSAVVGAGVNAELVYFDATLFKKVGTDSVEQISEPGVDISVTITIPDELINRDESIIRSYFVLRLHNGEVTIIEGTFDEAAKEFTFETDKFSTYALVFKDVAIPNNPPVNPGPTEPANPVTPVDPKPADTVEKPAVDNNDAGPDTSDKAPVGSILLLMLSSLDGMALIMYLEVRRRFGR